MPDLAAIASAASGLQAAGQIVKSLVGLKISAEVQAKVIELQAVIMAAQGDALAAQSDQFALLQRVRELEAQVAQSKAWDREKKRYDLKEISRGVFTYVVKPEARGSEPVHCICASCYQHSERSILQSDGGVWGTATLTCPKCNVEIKALERGPNYPFEPSPPASL